jgi:branched-chain amino acid transport system permease protein
VTTFFQLVVAGVSVGSAYALVGIGLVLVFRTTNALNFAQGTYAVLAGLTTATLLHHMPTFLAALLALLLTTGVGLAMGFVTLAKGGETAPLISLIVTLGLSLVARAIELLVFGDAPHSWAPIGGHAWDIRGVLVQPQYVLVLAVTLVVTAALSLVLRYTVLGNALVACSDSHRAARIIGLDTRTLGATSFALAALLGGVAGVLVTPIVPVTYDADIGIAVNGFAAAAFGGLVSIPLTLAGGLVLGIAEKLVVGYVNPQYELAIALVIMLVLISWRARNEAVAPT